MKNLKNALHTQVWELVDGKNSEHVDWKKYEQIEKIVDRSVYNKIREQIQQQVLHHLQYKVDENHYKIIMEPGEIAIDRIEMIIDGEKQLTTFRIM